MLLALAFGLERFWWENSKGLAGYHSTALPQCLADGNAAAVSLCMVTSCPGVPSA